MGGFPRTLFSMLQRSISLPSYYPHLSTCPSVLSAAPITPPLSPARTSSDHDAIVVDVEPRYSGPHSAFDRDLADYVPSYAPAISSIKQMEHNVESDAAALSKTLYGIVLKPLNTTESRGPGLRLSDFEVRGTLGMSWRPW